MLEIGDKFARIDFSSGSYWLDCVIDYIKISGHLDENISIGWTCQPNQYEQLLNRPYGQTSRTVKILDLDKHFRFTSHV